MFKKIILSIFVSSIFFNCHSNILNEMKKLNNEEINILLTLLENIKKSFDIDVSDPSEFEEWKNTLNSVDHKVSLSLRNIINFALEEFEEETKYYKTPDEQQLTVFTCYISSKFNEFMNQIKDYQCQII